MLTSFNLRKSSKPDFRTILPRRLLIGVLRVRTLVLYLLTTMAIVDVWTKNIMQVQALRWIILGITTPFE